MGPTHPLRPLADGQSPHLGPPGPAAAAAAEGGQGTGGVRRGGRPADGGAAVRSLWPWDGDCFGRGRS